NAAPNIAAGKNMRITRHSEVCSVASHSCTPITRKPTTKAAPNIQPIVKKVASLASRILMLSTWRANGKADGRHPHQHDAPFPQQRSHSCKPGPRPKLVQ